VGTLLSTFRRQAFDSQTPVSFSLHIKPDFNNITRLDQIITVNDFDKAFALAVIPVVAAYIIVIAGNIALDKTAA
jgi:hypothetical protein